MIGDAVVTRSSSTLVGRSNTLLMDSGNNTILTVNNHVLSSFKVWAGDGIKVLRRDVTFTTSHETLAVADEVAIGGYEISAGHRALAISSEEVVVTETDETKFSHKIPVRWNGATYNLMLCAT